MARQITEHAQVAKLIRTELKKFSIEGKTSGKSYSGGNSVNVTLFDVSPQTFSKVQDFAESFKAGSFNGYEDIHEYDQNRTGPAAKFVFVNREWSEEITEAAKRYVEDNEDVFEFWKRVNKHRSEYAYIEALLGNEGAFWTQYKPRVKA